MSHIKEVVYTGRDNTVDLILTEDGVAIDHTTLNRVVLKFNGGLSDIDSDVSPTLFDYSAASKLVLKLGASALPVGKHWMRLVVYDPSNPNGVHWEPHVLVEVQ